MASSGFFERFGGALATAAVLIGVIVNPSAPGRALEKAKSFSLPRTALADKPCRVAGPTLTSAFADIEDVVSVSPLGGVTAPYEPLPAPYIRINTRKGETAFDRRETAALAPARADVVAVERRIRRNEEGIATSQSWTVHLSICEDVSVYYDDLDAVSPELMEKVGGLTAFEQIDGPDHTGVATLVRVATGDALGVGDGFDVGLEDRSVAPDDLVRPERYRTNPYAAARRRRVDPALIAAASTDPTRAQCPLDYLPKRVAAAWTGKLGDAYGLRKAKGDDACRTALVEVAGAAQGAWYTDAAHNGATSKQSAIALAPDTIDPKRMIFALHGRVPTLGPELVALPPKQRAARAAAAKDFLTFEAGGDGVSGAAQVNTPFKDVRVGETHCYQRLRANFVGPRIYGVVLLGLEEGPDGPVMRLEARGDAQSCADLEARAFSGRETLFYR